MICRPYFTKVIPAVIKRLIGVLKPLENCGVWYRRILKRLDIILCLIDCPGQMIGEEIDVPESITTLRYVDLKARKTYVTNLGTHRIKLYEDGALVQVLWPGLTWESPVTGRLLIEAEAIGGQTRVAITTQRHCECDLPITYYGEITSPVGGHLL